MSYLCYLCLFSCNGVQRILCCAFPRLVCPMLPISLDCPFWLPLWYSLTFILVGFFSVFVNCVIPYLFLFRFVLFMPLSTIFSFDFGIAPRVWYLCGFLFFSHYY